MKPILFFKGQMTMKAQPPKLSYNGRDLEPYWDECYNGTWYLYYTSDTPENTGWTKQLLDQGYSCQYGRLPDRSIQVVARRLQS